MRVLYVTALLSFALVCRAAPVLTVTVEPATSATYPAGTTFTNETGTQTHTSDTADPLGPFSGQSVHFRGYQNGGSSEQLDASRFLVFRYKLTFDQMVDLDNITVQGAAFNTDVMRLLDSGQNILRTLETFGSNSFRTINFDVSGVSGHTFYLEDWDASTFFRYRSNIQVDASASAVPEPATLALALLGLAGMSVWRRCTAAPSNR